MSTSSAVNRLGGPAVIALVIVAMVAVTAAKVWESTHTSRATIWFTDGTGLFVGDPVKMRGVTIGTVEAVEATPAKVRVEVSYDDSAYVDSEARAAIVARPSSPVGMFSSSTRSSDRRLVRWKTMPWWRSAGPRSRSGTTRSRSR